MNQCSDPSTLLSLGYIPHSHTCGNLAMLRIRLTLLVAPSNAKLDDPDEQGNEHETGSSPSKSEELAAPLSLKADVVAILVDDLCALDNHGSHEGAGETNGQEGQRGDHEVQTRGEASRCQDGEEGGEQRYEDECDGDAVEDEHGAHQGIEGLDAGLDVLGPVEVLQGDISTGSLVQGVFQDSSRVEFVHCAALAAAGDVLGDVILVDGCVCDFSGRVLAVAVVEQVGRIPVFDAETFGYLADAVVDFFADLVGDLVEQIQNRVVAAAILVQECLAKHGCVELDGC